MKRTPALPIRTLQLLALIVPCVALGWVLPGVGSAVLAYSHASRGGLQQTRGQQPIPKTNSTLNTPPPAITCPANITASGGGTGVVVTYPPPITDPPMSTSCSPASGSTFPVGATTTVSCSITGAGGTYPSCSFTVTVTDTEPPSITCPANISVGTAGNSAVVNYPAPTVTDNLPGIGPVTCAPASGAAYPLGSTLVTCSVQDAKGNSASCTFRINVNKVAYSLSDPLQCTGPGNVVTGTFSLTNNSSGASSADATVALPPGLVAIPGSCVTNLGTCSVVNPSLVSLLMAPLASGQTVTVTYQAQVGDQVAPGTTLCTNLTASFGGGSPLTVSSCATVNCPVSLPGLAPGGLSEVSDQKAGSVLFFNLYTSSTSAPGGQNTRFTITNTETTRRVAVHLFFIDGSNCSVADRYICLTPSQTMSFLASEQDPATTGYLVAVAVDTNLGCPIDFNYLIGEESVKLSSGHAANLGAETISAIAGGRPLCTPNSVTASLSFDGTSYSRVGAVLASSGIGSRADGDDTLLVINRVGGDLTTSASSIGTLFGILYDDAESSHSFQLAGQCQLRVNLSNLSPRTTPRFETVIPSGSTGWLKVWTQSAVGLLGAQIKANPNATLSAGAFNQGHNLHKLRLSSSGSYVIPIFGPGC